MDSTDFSDEELAQLRAHGIVLFADRVIFDAQPPMRPAEIGAVRDRVGGQFPPALIALWETTAGGRLDYDLRVSMHGRDEAVSWCELFYNGSDGYRDLAGWIDHERECAQQGADERREAWNGRLFALPFGGFEYCDRVYVVIAPEADDHGHVLAWKMGLPPAWKGAMHADGLGLIATDLHAAFRALRLDADPLEPTSDYEAGSDCLDYIDRRRDDFGMSPTLADKVIDFYRKARTN